MPYLLSHACLLIPRHKQSYIKALLDIEFERHCLESATTNAELILSKQFDYLGINIVLLKLS